MISSTGTAAGFKGIRRLLKRTFSTKSVMAVAFVRLVAWVEKPQPPIRANFSIRDTAKESLPTMMG